VITVCFKWTALTREKQQQHGRHTGATFFATCNATLSTVSLPHASCKVAAMKAGDDDKRDWNWCKQLKNVFTCVTFHKNIIFILAAVRTWNPTYYNMSNWHIVNKLTYYLKYFILQTYLMNVLLINKC
jgi:hypothetical protein